MLKKKKKKTLEFIIIKSENFFKHSAKFIILLACELFLSFDQKTQTLLIIVTKSSATSLHDGAQYYLLFLIIMHAISREVAS
jgi:hypothetical protein